MTTSVTTVVRSRQAGWSIAFVECDPVLHGLESILNGWELVRLQKSRAARADVTITSTANGYEWVSETLPKPKYWDESPPLTARDAVSDIHDALFDWYQLAHPKRLCLHAGAVRVGSQLVCFPAVGKAGKSSLSIELAAAGHTFFCDDVLAIDGETLAGIALGVAPVMRRPFPHSPGARITAYAKAHLGLSNAKWAYVPPDLGRARHDGTGGRHRSARPQTIRRGAPRTPVRRRCASRARAAELRLPRRPRPCPRHPARRPEPSRNLSPPLQQPQGGCR